MKQKTSSDTVSLNVLLIISITAFGIQYMTPWIKMSNLFKSHLVWDTMALRLTNLVTINASEKSSLLTKSI